mgnify:CR=1 FL=1
MDESLREALAPAFQSWHSVFICGGGPQDFVDRLVQLLALQPREYTLALLTSQVEVAGLPDHVRCFALDDMEGTDFLRSASRQDPDCVVLDARALAAAEMALQLRQTGHRLILHLEAPPAQAFEAFIAALAGKNSDFPAPMLREMLARDYFWGSDGVWQVDRQGELSPVLTRLEGKWLRHQGTQTEPSAPSQPVDADSRVVLGDDEVQALRQRWGHLRRPGWRPVVGAEGASLLGGAAWLGADEPWPCCGDCASPLQAVLQLRLADLPKPATELLGSSGWLQFFYCVDPGCPSPEAWTTTAQNRLARWLDQAERQQEPPRNYGYEQARIQGWEEIQDWPDWADLQLEEAEHEALPNERGDKLMGWPAWAQASEVPPCPDCGQPMPMVFQVNAEGFFPQLFAADGTGHLFACSQHRRLAFSWACG